VIDQGSQLCEGVRGKIHEDVDVDLETLSDEGWSVTDNTIALEENSSEMEIQRRQTSTARAFNSFGKLSFVEGASRQAVSSMHVGPCKTYSLDSGLNYARWQKHEPNNYKGNDIRANKLTPKSL
jgi:hypothetical protein